MFLFVLCVSILGQRKNHRRILYQCMLVRYKGQHVRINQCQFKSLKASGISDTRVDLFHTKFGIRYSVFDEHFTIVVRAVPTIVEV